LRSPWRRSATMEIGAPPRSALRLARLPPGTAMHSVDRPSSSGRSHWGCGKRCLVLAGDQAGRGSGDRVTYRHGAIRLGGVSSSVVCLRRISHREPPEGDKEENERPGALNSPGPGATARLWLVHLLSRAASRSAGIPRASVQQQALAIKDKMESFIAKCSVILQALGPGA